MPWILIELFGVDGHIMVPNALKGDPKRNLFPLLLPPPFGFCIFVPSMKIKVHETQNSRIYSFSYLVFRNQSQKFVPPTC